MAVGKVDLQQTVNAQKGKSYEAEYLTLSEPWDIRHIPSLALDPQGQQRAPNNVAPYAIESFLTYSPSTGATGTGGFLMGAPWTPGGTVSHPTPAATNLVTQYKRTKFTDVITTTNQRLGIRMNAASELQFWLGNAVGLGGFFFSCVFALDGSTQAATTRLFIGLADSTTSVCIADAVAGNVIGLWHDTTDAAGVLSLVVRNNTTTTKIPIPGVPANALASGQGYAFYMACPPNSNTVYYRLDDLLLQQTIVDSFINTTTAPTMPLNTAFMGPQAEVSNGTANIVAGDTGIDIMSLFCEG